MALPLAFSAFALHFAPSSGGPRAGGRPETRGRPGRGARRSLKAQAGMGEEEARAGVSIVLSSASFMLCIRTQVLNLAHACAPRLPPTYPPCLRVGARACLGERREQDVVRRGASDVGPRELVDYIAQAGVVGRRPAHEDTQSHRKLGSHRTHMTQRGGRV